MPHIPAPVVLGGTVLVILLVLLHYRMYIYHNKVRQYRSLQKTSEYLKGIFEISRVFNKAGGKFNPVSLLCQITLNSTGADTGLLFLNTGQGFQLGAYVGTKPPNEPLQGDRLHELLLRAATTGKPLPVQNCNGWTLPDGPAAEKWPGNQYRSGLVFPFSLEKIKLVALLYSEKANYFIPSRLMEYELSFAKTARILNMLMDDPVNSPPPEEIDLLSAVCCLTARLFVAEGCFIALRNAAGQLAIKGTFGRPAVTAGMLLSSDDELTLRNSSAPGGNSTSSGVAPSAPGHVIAGTEYSNLTCVPIAYGENLLGYMAVVDKKEAGFVGYEDFSEEETLLLNFMANQLGLAIENNSLFARQQESFITTIRSLVSALEARDAYTKGHSEQVAFYAAKIANEMGLPETEIKNIRFAALLHDIGKIGISEHVLNKPGRLTEEEYNHIKTHPFIGFRILKHMQIFAPLVPYIYHHHERWDGTGYPDGLKGEDIPLGARIIAVADTFDALTSDRVYRKRQDQARAVNEIIRCSGTQFDPAVVTAFINVLEKSLFEDKTETEWPFEALNEVFRDVLDRISNGKLVIARAEDIGRLKKESRFLGELPIRHSDDISRVRQLIQAELTNWPVSENDAKQVLLCVSESAVNMLKHAAGGNISWYRLGPSTLRIFAEDNGPGLKLSDLPKDILVTSRRSKKSLGLGFTIMFGMLDRVYLKTSEKGTTLVLERDFSGNR
ncbi:HD domain-containing phosphohydrolase [Thermincola potens]|uniref:Metal dependent phosphohydrolase n=1 Tax=Thermincola potens (strain JR) TaxID=635013 RepID=D5XB76_THEPJ|nr:HD domain-containing phosphohydrolase [Thermincola potens]ADG81396.1 metal dependent phosphohydrolase [Thermincola potens JR]